MSLWITTSPRWKQTKSGTAGRANLKTDAQEQTKITPRQPRRSDRIRNSRSCAARLPLPDVARPATGISGGIIGGWDGRDRWGMGGGIATKVEEACLGVRDPRCDLLFTGQVDRDGGDSDG
jgi:hypothetical protein